MAVDPLPVKAPLHAEAWDVLGKPRVTGKPAREVLMAELRKAAP